MSYNSRKEPQRLTLPEGEWEILADGQDSFLWKKPETVEKAITMEPVSMLCWDKKDHGEEGQ